MSAYGLARNWWWIALRGLFAVLFVLAALLGSYFILAALVLLFGAYSLADGGLTIVASLTGHNGFRLWGLWLIEGLMSIGAGVLAFLSPSLTAFALMYLIVAWATVTGALAITSALQLCKANEKAGLLALSGIVSVAVGVILVIWPEATVQALIWLLGANALGFGLLQMRLGFRLRNFQRKWLSLATLRQPGWAGVQGSRQE